MKTIEISGYTKASNTQQIFGSCNYSIEEDYAHIFNLYVQPEYRNKGCAKEILRRAIKHIKEDGWKDEIQIVCNPTEEGINKERLWRFYESLGLKVFESYV